MADYTSTDLLIRQVRCDTAAEVIAELAAALGRAGRLGNQEAFVDAVMARERMSPTSFCSGWAFPHARLGELPQLSFSMGLSTRPFAWVGKKAARVQMVCLFAVPEVQAKQYLNVIASMAKLSQDSDMIQRLLSAPNSKAIYSVLAQVPLPCPQVTPFVRDERQTLPARRP